MKIDKSKMRINRCYHNAAIITVDNPEYDMVIGLIRSNDDDEWFFHAWNERVDGAVVRVDVTTDLYLKEHLHKVDYKVLRRFTVKELREFYEQNKSYPAPILIFSETYLKDLEEKYHIPSLPDVGAYRLNVFFRFLADSSYKEGTFVKDGDDIAIAFKKYDGGYDLIKYDRITGKSFKATTDEN